MNPVVAQQVALDNALVAPEKRLKIEKCNMRIEFNKPQRETTYQVTLDVLKLSPYYLAFLMTAEVPKIYMHQFWNTIKKIKDIDAYQFKLDKQKFRIDTEVFHEILQICPRLPNQDFVEPPSNEEMVSFIKKLGYTGKCDMLSEIHIDQMHSPGEHLMLSSIGASLGSPQENVDFVALLWEDFMFQADNRDISHARKENMPYPRFTKVIINHFISKDKTIFMRNMINLHTIQDDSLLGTLIYVSKTEDYHKYGALIPKQMINQAIKDSKAYKIYLAFATGKATPKKSRKFKKIASPSKKQTLVLEDEPTKKPKWAKHPEPAKKSTPAKKDVSSKKPSRKKSTGVQIKDTPDVFVSKKKASTTTDRSKGGLSEGSDSKSKALDEPKVKSIDISKGTSLKPGVPNVSIADYSKSENKYWGDSGDEANEQGDDEDVLESDMIMNKLMMNKQNMMMKKKKHKMMKEYEELYGDVNISLTDDEPTDKEKGDEKMTNTETVDVDLENVNQEGAGNQVKDDAQATQKTEVPLPSSSISSYHAAKYLNFDNIPPVDTKVVSMLDVNVHMKFLVLHRFSTSLFL
ncbi:hypothetical protein Tco_0199947 [Tanacetum coccineum]